MTKSRRSAYILLAGKGVMTDGGLVGLKVCAMLGTTFTFCKGVFIILPRTYFFNCSSELSFIVCFLIFSEGILRVRSNYLQFERKTTLSKLNFTIFEIQLLLSGAMRFTSQLCCIIPLSVSPGIPPQL